jgi:hypothetical protein
MTNNDEREAFEAWVKEAHPVAPLTRHEERPDVYDGVLAAWTWGAWQARAACQPAAATGQEPICTVKVRDGRIHLMGTARQDAALQKMDGAPLYAAPIGDNRSGVEGGVDWRELCRRLYVELFHCDQQMTQHRDENDEVVWTQGVVVRDALADAKAALESTPHPAQPAESKRVGQIDQWEFVIGNFGALESAIDLADATGNNSQADGLRALLHACKTLAGTASDNEGGQRC